MATEGEGEVTREKTRIYVGGLGAGVTENDLRKTFSALGEVVSVDVVRTKGRSFAYLDFLPSSDKSLPKLFSTYNGCMWKGGKLRLEKAKEHYLLKLRREWQEEEDSENAKKTSDTCNADASESHDALEKPKKPSSEINKQLCLFFPKLGKVKSLGQVGIGKHKYSFQRIQVPPIPTHFCDCEEHSLPFLPTTQIQDSGFEKASAGINEQELNIMNSVMNKIFERANPSKHVTEKPKPINDESAAIENSEEEDHLTDEDNLVINVANGSDSMDLLTEMKTMMANQDNMHDDGKKKMMRANRVLLNNNQKAELVNDDSTAAIANDDEDNLIINVANESDSMDLLAEMRMMANKSARTKVQEGQEKKAIKKRKSPHSKEKPVIPESSRSSQTRLDTRKARKTEVESDTKQPVTKSLRSLKSTWKDLIGQKVNTPSTIPNVIPTVHQEERDKSNGDGHLEMKTTESDIHPRDSDRKEDQTESECLPEKLAGDMIPAAGGGLRRQKSSWTQLVSTASHGSFSISQIVPGLSFGNHEPVHDPSPSPSRVATESTGRKEMSSE